MSRSLPSVPELPLAPAVPPSSDMAGSAKKWADLVVQGLVVGGLAYLISTVISNADKQHKDMFQLQQSVAALQQMHVEQHHHRQMLQAQQQQQQQQQMPPPRAVPQRASTSGPVNPRDAE